MARSRKMRLSGAEIHQLGALRAQLRGLGGHRHRRGNLNAADTVGQYLLSSRCSHRISIFSDFRDECVNGGAEIHDPASQEKLYPRLLGESLKTAVRLESRRCSDKP